MARVRTSPIAGNEILMQSQSIYERVIYIMGMCVELALLFLIGLAPSIIAVMFLIYQSKINMGFAAFGLLFISFSCTIVALVMKFRQYRRVPQEDVEDPSVDHAPIENSSSATEPPKYDQLYPYKQGTITSTGPTFAVASPQAYPQRPCSPQIHLQPSLYVNPTEEASVHLPNSLQSGSLLEQDGDALPTYDEAVLMSREMQP